MQNVMSALTPKADMCSATTDVRFVPKADIGAYSGLVSIEHEVNKLRNLDVIDSDLGLALLCDDQVLLLGPIQFKVPSG